MSGAKHRRDGFRSVAIEFLDALTAGGDCVLSEEATLSVRDGKNRLVISK